MPEPSSPGVALGLEVRSARSVRRLSLRGLGDRIGVSPSLVSQIERGQVRPSLATLVALAVELELSLDATFGLRPGPSQPPPENPPSLQRSSNDPAIRSTRPGVAVMTHVSVLGGTGYGGTQVVKEALRRGHTVTVLSRSAPADPIAGVTYLQGSISDRSAIERATDGAGVIIGAISPRGATLGTLVDGYGALMARATELGARMIVIGGFGSLRYEESGPRVIESVDSLGLPADHVAEGKEMDRVRQSLMDDAPDALDWLFVCPAAVFGAYNEPTPPRGTYRVADDVAIFDDGGNSAIEPEDLALAILDEVETPTRHRGLIHFAY